MTEMGLAARIRRKRKYLSYQGEVGKKADNLIQRQFEGSKPYEKCYTDVTEFALPNSHQRDYYKGTTLHSDQGWQYQHESYHHFLSEKGIRPSMSRKGNSPDNGMIESFFGILKSEMFYGFENTLQSLDELEEAITNYIFYYNNKRIKDLVLCNTELNPFTNIFLPNFLVSVQFNCNSF